MGNVYDASVGSGMFYEPFYDYIVSLDVNTQRRRTVNLEVNVRSESMGSVVFLEIVVVVRFSNIFLKNRFHLNPT